MSRSLGLREDQRLAEVLVTRIAGLFPMGRIGLIASKLAPTGDLVYPGNEAKCGSLLAMGPVQPGQN
ncbi:hypothetical protein PHLH5_50040 [Pseudomonas sp. Cab53]|uniref:Uncharacterized protein n=3 Tax=Pseudomonas TaxID=286 RepID=A0A0G3G7M4_9PSED|nr:hypothetical protein VM99_03930 [Pseudomonas chlororaphis]KIQ59601.1 hypothetical protein RL74_09760 [Pseudomonas fluorescens]ROM78120.1 hypothetical protein BK652_23225 [Pseudomonas brassicacearum]BBP67463.1 hypothetical protein PHLH5_50040 [Pseudomonas sp. Cab53]